MNSKILKLNKLFSVLLVAIFIFSACESVNDPIEVNVPLEEKIGQMILIGFRGFTVDAESNVVNDIKAGRIGGVVLYDRDVALGTSERNIQSPQQVEALISSLQSYTRTKLFVSIDQEGGRVNRLKEIYGFPSTVSHQYLGDLNNSDSTYFYASRIANSLASLGINLNFAPVVDLNVNPSSPAIGNIGRSFSDSSKIVVKHAQIYMNAHANYKVLTTLKHFPGHGSAMADSHQGFTDVSNTWSEKELEPYKSFINNGMARIIMTAHIFNNKLDPEYPATLSEKILTDLLRNEMNYNGIIISDDMNMGAISQHYGLETAIEKGINAGLDILLFANNLTYDPDIASKAQTIILELIEQGRISEARINESYERIMNLKNNYIN